MSASYSSRFSVAAGLLVEDSDDEVLIYDTVRHRAYCLKEEAANHFRFIHEGASANTRGVGPATLDLDTLEELARVQLIVATPDVRGARLPRRRLAQTAASALILSVPITSAAQMGSCSGLGLLCSPGGCCSGLLCVAGICIPP